MLESLVSGHVVFDLKVAFDRVSGLNHGPGLAKLSQMKEVTKKFKLHWLIKFKLVMQF